MVLVGRLVASVCLVEVIGMLCVVDGEEEKEAVVRRVETVIYIHKKSPSPWQPCPRTVARSMRDKTADTTPDRQQWAMAGDVMGLWPLGRGRASRIRCLHICMFQA